MEYAHLSVNARPALRFTADETDMFAHWLTGATGCVVGRQANRAYIDLVLKDKIQRFDIPDEAALELALAMVRQRDISVHHDRTIIRAVTWIVIGALILIGALELYTR
ncbi:hypothetical protein ELH26_35570 [Rhizobium leguminosarum]|uniref:hypothetical protein n=1 Tax=Rhizobium leguminosarum TaxID=384 RepID=UPI0010312753|nr:hypothetical protein [Rhizobium leguminosarum]TBC86600.1 hypothetical protein ELH26_35570 [Rhizobium leguminosarum]